MSENIVPRIKIKVECLLLVAFSSLSCSSNESFRVLVGEMTVRACIHKINASL